MSAALIEAPLIEARDLVVQRGGQRILDGLSLTVAPNELIAVVGPNGSGKSTALRVMAGAIEVEGGAIFYDGRPAAGLDPLVRSRFVAFLPPDFRSHWDQTVAELLRLGATRGDGFGWMTALHKTTGIPAELIRDFELEPLIGRRLSTLSGGERARAALAATLAGQPRLLLADEPAANLDIGHQLRTMRRLWAIKALTGSLVVVHDLNLAGRFADRIVVMNRGRCALAGPAREVLDSPILDDVFEVKFERRPAPWGALLVPLTSL